MALPMEWQDLTNLTRGKSFVVERVRLASGVAIEGEFEPPQLAQLSLEDQVFVAAFVRCHGSIKEMERIFGVSYPTIKSRLNRIGQGFEFMETAAEPTNEPKRDPIRDPIRDPKRDPKNEPTKRARSDVIERLHR